METIYGILAVVAKKLCPSSKRIARNAATKIQQSYNKIEEGKRTSIAEYAQKAAEIGRYGEELRRMVEDGQIDDLERDRIADLLAPIIEAGKNIVFG